MQQREKVVINEKRRVINIGLNPPEENITIKYLNDLQLVLKNYLNNHVQERNRQDLLIESITLESLPSANHRQATPRFTVIVKFQEKTPNPMVDAKESDRVER